MGAFVAGSHELSPSINYLLHNKIYSGQQQQQQHQANQNQNGDSQNQNPDADSNHLESSSSGTSSVSNKIDISAARRSSYQQQQQLHHAAKSGAHHHFHEVLPPLPPIKGQGEARRLPPLTIEEYERDYRELASDFKLVDRVYLGGLASNKLRAALWPYLFGLVKRRGRFIEASGKIFRLENGQRQLEADDEYHDDENDDDDDDDHVYLEHEENLNRWKELERLYLGYQQQWKSITADQERRFSSFRERKSLIERDVIRSDRSHPFYADKLQNLTNLTTLLMTYMMYDFDIGYLQGMSDLAAPILYVYQGNLVKSFWVFVEMMKLFRRNFEFSQKTIHFQLNCLYRLVKMTDPKFGQFLKRADCSNCFFAFRCIVCQFKRELMRQHNDYDKVLRLWDTIWCVQRRHELLARSKVIHTYTITNGPSRRGGQQHQHQPQRLANSWRHSHLHRSPTQPLRTSLEANAGAQTQLSNSYNGWPLSKHGSPSESCHLNGNGSGKSHRRSVASINGCCNQPSLKRQTSGSRLSSPQRHQDHHNHHHQYSHHHHHHHHHHPHHHHCKPAVKQEQVIYTRETFYSSFDPDQADVPRFELTETEKFVMALCLSLIRRDRNQILQERMDATEIHQHFIAPNLAQDLDGFIEQAYHIYHYLNTDCDLQLLVKGANGGWSLTNAPSSPLGSSLGDPSLRAAGANGNATGDDTADTADTYDLLRDYLIISPSSHESSFGSKQRHWDHFLNNNNHHHHQAAAKLGR